MNAIQIAKATQKETVQNPFPSSKVISLFNKKEQSLMEKSTIYFENNFGKIYGDCICIGEGNQILEIKEVAFLRIRSQVDKTYNGIALMISVIAFINVFYFQNNFMLLSLLMGITVLNFFIFIMFKKEVFFVQVILCRIEQIVIKINKKQQGEVDEFVRKLSIYRHQNPNLKL